MKLSILICTLESRSHYLKRLLSILDVQKTEEVEILTNLDNGEKSIGWKRNELLKSSKGEYICFIDDDDTVSDNYISSILECIEKSPDAIGLELVYYKNRAIHGIAYHSIKNMGWWEEDIIHPRYNMAYYRFINHLNSVKRELAIQCIFPDENAGEDLNYSEQLVSLLKKEEYITGPIYHYHHNTFK
jgi:glycosyltransferase involved in cell wall biosynthesis